MTHLRSPRKIALVIGTFNGGGTEHFLVRFLRSLDRTRFEPHVVTLSDSGPLRDAVYELAPVYVVRLTGKLFNRNGLAEMARLRRWFRDERIDLVHSLIDRATIFAGLAQCLSRNRPFVVSHRIREPSIDRGLTLIYFQVVRRLADAVVPNAHAVAAWLRERGVPGRRITVVPNGILPERIKPVVERPLDASPVTLCTVARLMPVKGQRHLIEAVAALRRDGYCVRAVLVGVGPDETMLRQLAGDLDVASSVEFTGFLSDPIAKLQESDICVLPSYNEGLPNAVIEYLAAGRPVVATAVAGTPEIVIPEKTGLLVPPGETPALTAALKRLIEDPDLRHRMGHAGRALVEAEHTAEREAERTMAVYDRMLDGT